MKKRKIRKKTGKNIKLGVGILVLLLILVGIKSINKKHTQNSSAVSIHLPENKQSELGTQTEIIKENSELLEDWRITLVNREHILPQDFTVELFNIDATRQFDVRAKNDLLQMMNDMRCDGITNIWIQSSYRSMQKQTTLYQNRVQEYLRKGKTQEEAEDLTQMKINKPGASEHNLGLAIDFNDVSYRFEQLVGFKWLQKNAAKYGFILRYEKEKEQITQVSYEPWHWRYVGQEHANMMNQKNMCLEEYVEYLKGGNTNG